MAGGKDQRRAPLAERVLARATAGSLVILLFAFLLVFFFAFERLRNERLDELARLAEYRASQQQDLFDRVKIYEENARRSLLTRVRRASALDSFDHFFPVAADGTRRSAPGLFEGTALGDGDHVAGIGAFIPRGGSLQDEDKALLMAGFQVVRQFGPAFELNNFWFFTPQDDLIIYAPERPDRLSFYRSEASRAFTFQDLEFARNASPQYNPERRMRCTSLSVMAHDQTGQRLTSGCQTPVDIEGRHVGAFGVSLELGGWLKRAAETPADGVTAMLLESNGSLLAHPELIVPGQDLEKSRTLSDELGLPALAALAEGRAGILPPRQTGDRYYAFARVEGPDWLVLMSQRRSHVLIQAALAALLPALVALFAMMAVLLISSLLVRNVVAKPLSTLTRAASQERERSQPMLRGESQRGDEIGALAGALLERDERVSRLVDTLEDKVNERTAALEAARREADAQNAAKTQFLASMSHEIRTPMNGVVGMAQILRGTPLDDEQREVVSVLQRSSESLLSIINDVLDLAKIEAGRMEVDPIDFSLEALIEEVRGLFAAVASGKGLRLDIAIEDAAAGWYRTDAPKLRQLLNNLVSNAIKFTETGHVQIGARLAGEGHLQLFVEDTGIGIPEDARRRIFEKFVQADASTTRRYGGTGLGLAICREIAALLGGEVAVAPREGGGSTFTATLPLKRIAPATRTAEAEAVPAGASIALAGARVLAADDNAVNRVVLDKLLRTMGIEAVLVEDGQQAVDAWRGGRWDAILMDVQMPVLDGLEATRAIRAEEAAKRLPRTPIIAITADVMADQVSLHIETGMDCHVPKPVRLDTLKSALSRALAGKEERVA